MNKDNLKSLDDIFGIETPLESEKEKQSDDNRKDAVVEIEIERLHDYKKGNLTERYSEADMEDLVVSIKEHGVIQPAVVRPDGDEYEIILGHHRRDASILADKNTLPCIVKEMDDDTAELLFIESNIQKGFDDLPYSKKAELIFRRSEALKRQGKRTDLIPEDEQDDTVKDEFHLSASTIKRFLRIYQLSDGLKSLLDKGDLSIRVAVDLSYLDFTMQAYVNQILEKDELKIKTSQSEILKKASQEGNLTEERIQEILASKVTTKQNKPYKLDNKLMNTYFKEEQGKEEIDRIIREALDLYFSKSRE